MAALADIIDGATVGSQLVKVRLNQADNTLVVVCRGNVQLGGGAISQGQASVVLSSPLALGDVIQASVDERGKQAGLPVTVTASTVRVTGWKTPTEIEVIELASGEALRLSAEEFFAQYGYLLPSIYDPAGSRAIVYPEYEPQPTGAIQLTILIRQEPGQTYVICQNITNIRGVAQVKWSDAEEYSTDLSRVFTSAQTVNLSVKGSNDTNPATRSISVTVLGASSSPSSGDITGVCYRFNNGTPIRLMANSTKQLEGRLYGYNDWRDFAIEEGQYQECFFENVPNGVYQPQVRVKNDTNMANWRSLTINKY